MKNIEEKDRYVAAFEKRIVSTFCAVFEKVSIPYILCHEINNYFVNMALCIVANKRWTIVEHFFKMSTKSYILIKLVLPLKRYTLYKAHA